MAAVVGVALLIGLAAAGLRRGGLGLAESLLDLLLALPSALAVLLALVARDGNQRLALGRFLASAPMLGLVVVHFHVVFLGILSFEDLALKHSLPRPRSIAPLLALPWAYFSLILALLPFRCPRCRSQSLERVAPNDPTDRHYWCDECGVGCRRTDEKTWEIEDVLLNSGLAVSASFGPKLRALRDELRPGQTH